MPNISTKLNLKLITGDTPLELGTLEQPHKHKESSTGFSESQQEWMTDL